MLKKFIAGTALICAASMANAAVITQSGGTSGTTNIIETSFTIDLFDDMGGTRTLESVSVSISGGIDGAVNIESLDAEPATVSATLTADLFLADAIGNVLVITVPSIVGTADLTAFDSVIDFGGTSGVMFPDLMAESSDSELYTDIDTLSFFTGTGSVDLLFSALANSRAEGAGNIISQITTNANAEY